MSELLTDYRESEDRLQYLAERFRSSPLATTETYSFFEPDDEASVEKRATQKELFLSGEIRNPELHFPKLERVPTVESIRQEENFILGLMSDTTQLAHDPDREAVLYDLLRVRRLEMGMLLMASDFTGSEFDDEPAKTANLYNRINDEINGRFDTARFNGLLIKHQSRAKWLLENEDIPVDVREAATYFLANTTPVNNETVSVMMPVEVDQERFKKLQGYLSRKFADLLDCAPDKPDGEKYTAEEVAEIFRRAHAIRHTGWETRLQPGKSNIDTRQDEEATVVGTERERTASNTRGILVHENGIHVQRRINGDRSGDPLLSGLGLPWYLASEEGLTTIAQQAIEGKIKESGEQYYLAIGLSRGVDGTPRDFRDVYELELSRRIMADYADGKKAEGLDKLHSQSYATTLRVRRGTRAETPGATYSKDIVYYLGNQQMWETMLSLADLPEDQRDEEFDLLLAAKYDPMNPIHSQIVQQAVHKQGK